MGDLIFPDFVTKSRQYTKGGGLDDLKGITDAIRTIGRDGYDTAPSEMPPVQPMPAFVAPTEDGA